MITIIGVPISLQLFKVSRFIIWPLNKKVVYEGGFPSTFINILWAITFGWEFALGFIISGALFCVTIIGIPFGKQYFKLAKYIFIPLGMKFK